MCQDVFGNSFTSKRIDQNIKETNDYYGGKNFQGTRVYFTNGEFDPWSPLGFYYAKKGSQIESIVIKGKLYLYLKK